MFILTILGWVLAVGTSLFLTKGAIDKIRGTKEMKGNFNFMKLEKYRVVTGFGELLGAVLLLVPSLSPLGVLLICCFMSGAVSLHLSLMGGAKTHIPALIGFIALVSELLRSLL